MIRIKAETRKSDYGEAPTVFHALLDEQSVIKGKKEEDVETMSGIGALIYVAAVEVSMMLVTWNQHPDFATLDNRPCDDNDNVLGIEGS